MLEPWSAELRFTFRYLARTPGCSVVAILALGLGIGANTAIFSGVNTLLRAMQSLLFGVQPLDPTSLLWSLAVLLVAALIACLLPALRAARVNPLLALREE